MSLPVARFEAGANEQMCFERKSMEKLAISAFKASASAKFSANWFKL